MQIPFPRWRPDLYDVDAVNEVAGEAKGVLIGPNGYLPWPSAVNYSTALAAACRGGIMARNTSGSFEIFAGTNVKLYKFVDPGTAWTDVTRASGGDYTVPSDERWGMAQYKTDILATNKNDVLQYIDATSGTNFAAVGGSPPQAGGVTTVGSFVMLYDLTDNPQRLQWSGRGDKDYWTPGQRDSGLQDFPDGGPVLGVSNLETGLIFQEGAIRRYRPVNSRAVFEFGRVEDSRGLKGPDSLVILGRTAYYLSEDGFYSTTGEGQSFPIGAEKVDDWFQSVVEYDRLYFVNGTADPTGRRIFWLFPSSGNTGESLDYCLCYDRFLEDWTYADSFATSFLMAAATPGQTVEGMDDLIADQGYTSIEDYPVSFDSKSLSGGAPYLTGFHGTTFKMQQHLGAARAAVLETADWQPIPGKRAYVQGCRLMTDATNATATLGRKERPQGSVTFGSAKSQTGTGLAPIRGSTRYARIRMSIAASETWNHARGVDVMIAPEGEL